MSLPEVVPVSVVVVNRNGADSTVACVQSIQRSKPRPVELVVVDNGSADGSLVALRGVGNVGVPCRIISLSENRGPAAARNLGVSSTYGEILAFVDNDAVVQEDWLEHAIASMSAQGLDCVQCKLLFSANEPIIDSLGYLAGPFGFPRHLVRPGDLDNGQFDEDRELFGVKSAGMLVKRLAFTRAGGFDERFFIYGEETDLCWRMMRIGARIGLSAKSIVYHRPGGSHRFFPVQARELLYRGGTRNYIRMVVKNTTNRRLLFDVSGQVIVWLGVAGYQACRGKWSAAKLIVRGITDAMAELPSLLRDRRSTTLPFVPTPRELRMGLTPAYIWRTAKAV